jgi:hypothetical protein
MKKTLISAVCFSAFSLFAAKDSLKMKLDAYKTVQLTTDVSKIEMSEREGLKQLIRAAELMDEIFRQQAFAGSPITDTIRSGNLFKYMNINYGPWDRLDDNKPFVKGIGPKPLGANFYPTDMTIEEFNLLNDPKKKDPYTIIVREDGQLKVVPYSDAYQQPLREASMSLRIASTMFKDSGFCRYLRARADALLSNQYDASDRLWLDMKDNQFDIILGPIENYEDKLFGTKTAYEAYVLVKDMEWSKKLDKYVAYLPELQSNLPVDAVYKAEKAGSSSQLNAYDVVYYGGDCNSGSKTIAVNLPNDENLQIEKGTRRSQFKNTIKAKFDYIMLPIANALVHPSQRAHVTFNAFFANTMFHEVAHGLGIKNTINNKGTVREALGPYYSALEEGKADILGLYMITQLYKKQVLTEGQLMDYYVTFMAGVFRSVRFGAASAHGQANMIRFNYFKEKGAFIKDLKTNTYKIDFNAMSIAMEDLSQLILKLQGDGDLAGVKQLVEQKGKIMPELQKDLDQLLSKNIPIDVVFEQGKEVLGLENMPAQMPNNTAPIQMVPNDKMPEPLPQTK